MPDQIPLVDYLVLDDGPPHLVAWEASDSGALYLERHNADPRSGETGFERRALSTEGSLRSFTIVHRDRPGIEVPYVSAVVDLDGGGVVRSTVTGVDPTPEALELGMSLQLTTFVAGTDEQGTEAVAFAFEPA